MCFLPSSPSDSLLIFFGKCLPPCGLIGLADKGVGPATGLDQWDSLLGVWSLCRNSQGGEVGGAQQVPKRRIPEAPSSCSVLPETWLVNCFFFFQFCKPRASSKFCFSFCSSMSPPHHMHIGNFQKWQSWKNSAMKVFFPSLRFTTW